MYGCINCFTILQFPCITRTNSYFLNLSFHIFFANLASTLSKISDPKTLSMWQFGFPTKSFNDAYWIVALNLQQSILSTFTSPPNGGYFDCILYIPFQCCQNTNVKLLAFDCHTGRFYDGEIPLWWFWNLLILFRKKVIVVFLPSMLSTCKEKI